MEGRITSCGDLIRCKKIKETATLTAGAQSAKRNPLLGRRKPPGRGFLFMKTNIRVADKAGELRVVGNARRYPIRIQHSRKHPSI
jgi:dihydropteroate synthase